MSVFEIAMLFCFGFAWPFSIYKSYKSRTNKGKSLVFLYIVLAGYLAGIMHKIMYSFDPVIVLYIVNGIMVLADIMLYYRNRRLLI
jgi:lipopolysaccharide export LptBFGC system permease protein LptF